jgi:hypothetical protein
MRRNIPAIFAISSLVVLILCSGCTSAPTGEKKEGGLSQVTIPVETSRISFADANQKLDEYSVDSVNETAVGKTIYYIVAKDIDESGNATSWVFGINQGAGAMLLVYDRTGWTVFPWSSNIPEKIAIDQIVSPETLFGDNKAIIVTTPSQAESERRDLELQQGIYTLTIYSGNTNRILTFNATTGALITQT